MNRRDFLGAFAAGTFSIRHRVAFAQQPTKARRVGIIGGGPPWDYFRERLRDLGDIDGQNITIETRTADRTPERLLAVAQELASPSGDMVVVSGLLAAKAVQEAPQVLPAVSQIATVQTRIQVV